MRQIGINLSVARACFVRCEGCYNHFGRAGTLVETDIVIAFLARARDAGVGKVTLCGGDPLARPDIVPLLENVKALGFSIHLDTVGTPLLGVSETIFYGRHKVAAIDPGIVARLVDLVGIPVDGASDATIATFRAGRAGLLDNQLRIIAALDSVGARICVNTVVHRRNIDEIRAIAPLVGRYPSVVRWQLFQFAPLGPLGYRNRHAFIVTEQRFTELRPQLLADAARRHWNARIELKTNTDRKGRYVLIDSEGIAWMPRSSTAGPWDPMADATDERVIVGDIRRPADQSKIVDVILGLQTPDSHRATVGQSLLHKGERQHAALDA